ncbi:MAG: hypothetical protein IH983_04165 [Planctomycetes bacterium]|nr:hypothetical protein [Planctomycetota bacterium]
MKIDPAPATTSAMTRLSSTNQICWDVTTPSAIYIEKELLAKLGFLETLTAASCCRVLYSIKACSLTAVLNTVAPVVHGFATSSVFEARLARQIVGENGEVHFASPCLKGSQIRSLGRLVDRMSFNSIGQLRAHSRELSRCVKVGLRLNPRLSFVADSRYDPCREHSHLGVTVDQVGKMLERGDRELGEVSGIHFHNNCEAIDWTPLLETVESLCARLEPLLKQVEWINLGGGYTWDKHTDFGPLRRAIELLTTNYGLEVFLEPGDGIVNSAGYLVASVIDLFDSEGKTVAVLDTTVNHLPEVFEYQYEPDVAGHVDDGPHKYILAGCSCLAGDVFGDYAFEEPLEIGSRITFENAGAYSLVKANMFNGINLPSIYIQREDGELELIREFTYEDYLARCGGEAHAAARAGV